MVVFYSSSVFAQSQLRPPSAIIALVLMGMIVFVAGVSFLFARLVKAVLQKARKEKRKHIGYQIVFGVLFSIISQRQFYICFLLTLNQNILEVYW